MLVKANPPNLVPAKLSSYIVYKHEQGTNTEKKGWKMKWDSLKKKKKVIRWDAINFKYIIIYNREHTMY